MISRIIKVEVGVIIRVFKAATWYKITYRGLKLHISQLSAYPY